MKKIMATAAAAICAMSVFAAPRGPRASQNHVPENLDNVRNFIPEAAKYNHIALVNVGGAIAEEDWRLATTYAVSLLQINVWTNAIEEISVEKLASVSGFTAQALGSDKSKIGVYFVNAPGLARVIAAPGSWAVVNVADLKADSPSDQVYRDRVAKCVMKGLAASSGGGATLEPFCSLFYGAQDLAGMDKTNIAISPMCYFPMLEILRSVGGNEIISPAGECDEEE